MKKNSIKKKLVKAMDVQCSIVCKCTQYRDKTIPALEHVIQRHVVIHMVQLQTIEQQLKDNEQDTNKR